MKKLWKGAKTAVGMVLAVAMIMPSGLGGSVSADTDSTIRNPEAVTLANGVVLSETAQAVEGRINTWDVTLKVESPKVQLTSDTVMVVDTSYSMNQNNRMSKAKDAMRTLARQLLPDGNITNRIAIVSYNNKATVSTFGSSAFSRVYSAMDNRIGNLQAQYKGGTFTQAGIREAAKLLADSSADVKSIILLSDGEPTYNYAIDDPDMYLVDGGPGEHEYEKQTSSEVPQTAFNYDEVKGSSEVMWDEYAKVQKVIGGESVDEYHYYNSGNCAIAEAGYYKNSNIGDLYTVVLSTNDTGEDILNQIAMSGKAYTATEEDLVTIFSQIGGRIESAIKTAEVSSVMNDGIVVASDSGVGTAGANYVNWTPNLEYDEATGKYIAEVTYRVEANDEVAEKIDTDGFVSLNKKSTIEYGSGKTADFPASMVKPLLVKITKTLVGHTCEQCTFYVKLERPDETNTIYEMGANTTKIIAGGLTGGRYSIEEIGSMRDTVSFKNYLIEYNQNIFDISAGQGGTIDITINNIYDAVDIVVTKHWEDNNDQDDLRKNYKLYVAIKMGDLYMEYRQLNIENTDETFVFSLPKYRNGETVEYSVEESTSCQTEKNVYKICNKYDGDSDYDVQIEGYNITNIHSTETTDETTDETKDEMAAETTDEMIDKTTDKDDEDKKDEEGLVVENLISPCSLNECSKDFAVKAPETGAGIKENGVNSENTNMMMSIIVMSTIIFAMGVVALDKCR